MYINIYGHPGVDRLYFNQFVFLLCGVSSEKNHVPSYLNGELMINQGMIKFAWQE